MLPRGAERFQRNAPQRIAPQDRLDGLMQWRFRRGAEQKRRCPASAVLAQVEAERIVRRRGLPGRNKQACCQDGATKSSWPDHYLPPSHWPDTDKTTFMRLPSTLTAGASTTSWSMKRNGIPASMS